MPVGSHKDAFKAHQMIKRVLPKDSPGLLPRMAADILLDFVKSQRQVNAREMPAHLPPDTEKYDETLLREALTAVDGLCGKCQESHDDRCFVNQSRRALIAALTGADIGAAYDGEEKLESLIERAAAMQPENPPAISETEPAADKASDAKDISALQSELDTLREKDIFRATLIDEVVETIRSVTQGDFAAEMPVHDDEQLGKVATAFNMMLGAINQTMARLDHLVAERNAELKQIMNTVPVGLLTLSAEKRINPEYSRAAARFFGEDDLRGRDFLDCAGLTRRLDKQRKQAEDYFDVVDMGILGPKELADLNPMAEIRVPARESKEERWLRSTFQQLQAEGAKLLVLLEDITEEKRLAEEVQQSHTKANALTAIAEDPDLFRDFLHESGTILDKAQELISAWRSNTEDLAPIHELFRGIHTIKGAAGSFGLESVATLSGKLEDVLSQAREPGGNRTGLQTVVEEGLAALKEGFNSARSLAAEVLGESAFGGETTVRIPLSALEQFHEALMTGASPDPLLDQLRAWQCVPAQKALAKALKIVPGLIQRLGKPIEFTLGRKEEPIPVRYAPALNTALIHLIRNAFDHGIESPEDREAAGKPDTGRVELSVCTKDETLQVTLSDDGKGLDPKRIVAKAIEKNMLTPQEAEGISNDEAIQLILKPGFSTAESVTDVSGRGVGLDAVVAALENDVHGSLQIHSTLGTGTKFILTIPDGRGVQSA